MKLPLVSLTPPNTNLLIDRHSRGQAQQLPSVSPLPSKFSLMPAGQQTTTTLPTCQLPFPIAQNIAVTAGQEFGGSRSSTSLLQQTLKQHHIGFSPGPFFNPLLAPAFGSTGAMANRSSRLTTSPSTSSPQVSVVTSMAAHQQQFPQQMTKEQFPNLHSALGDGSLPPNPMDKR